MEQHIDNIDFSRKSREIHDIIRLSDFKRLQDLCLNLEDSITFVLRGFENKHREACLELSIEGKLDLICQRCSEKLEHTIFLKSGFLLKEDIIKRQFNCKATGFWVTKSKDANFLLIMHEHLFIFKKVS